MQISALHHATLLYAINGMLSLFSCFSGNPAAIIMGFTFIVALLALAASITSAVFYVLQHNQQIKSTLGKDAKWALSDPGAIANMIAVLLTLLLVLITMKSGNKNDTGDGN